ncbi:unnamed protein product, partial [Symbiodinium sp. KB8]
MMEENGRQTLNLCSRFEASFELWRSARPGISRSGHVAATLFARPPQAAADFARVAPAFPSMPRSLWLSQEAYAAACFSHVAEQLQQMAEGWDATASTKAIMGPLAKQSTKQQLQLSGTRDSPARTFNSWFWRRSVNMRALWGMLNALLADEDARRGAPVEQLAYAKLGRWLKNYAPLREDWSREHMPWPKKETQEEQILQFLLAGNVQEAVKAAKVAGKHRLAALIPLAASGPDLKSRLHDVFRDIKGRFRDEPSSSKEMEESIRHCYTVLGCPSHAVAASQAPLGDGGYSSALADFLRSRPSSWLTALGVLVWYGGNRRSAEGGLLQGLLASLAKVHAAGLPNAPWYTEAGGSDAQTRDMFYA